MFLKTNIYIKPVQCAGILDRLITRCVDIKNNLKDFDFKIKNVNQFKKDIIKHLSNLGFRMNELRSILHIDKSPACFSNPFHFINTYSNRIDFLFSQIDEEFNNLKLIMIKLYVILNLEF